MQFERIKYLDWARENIGRFPYDLANSAVRRLRAEEFGLTLKQLPLAGPGDGDDPELLQTIAAIYKARPSQVALTSGATAGIFLALNAVVGSGDEVLLEVPNYEPLYRVPAHLGAEVKTIDRVFEKGFQLDLEALERRIGRNTRAVVLTNLHNPTGVATYPEKMQTIGQIAKEFGAHVVCSEVYLDCTFEKPLAPAFTLGENMISLGGLSKAYGLGPTRMGWIVADERVIQKVHGIEQYIYADTSYPSQRIALAALKKRADLRQRAQEILRPNFKILQDWVQSHEEVRWVEPDGGTVAFIRLLHGIDSWEFHRLAKEKYQTLVAPGDFFFAKGFFRISFGGDPEAFHRGLEGLSLALREVMKEKRV